MNYQTFEPSDDLGTFIKCYWTLVHPIEDSPERQTIVPDGCMEMIFHYGDLYKQYTDKGKYIIQPKCFVIGQLTRPLEIEPTGETRIFSVRFHPNGFLPFTTVPIKEMENKAVALDELFGNAGIEIADQILNADSTSRRIELIESFLLKRLIDDDTVNRIVKSTFDTILTAKGQLSVNELSEQINVSRRQLERTFSKAIGLSPKQLSKTVRLQATLNMLLNKKFSKLTELAYENEYYDQAHFIKDFKELTGFTPKEFYGNKLKMSSLFYGRK
jgi:AraC-like DNA-binding protein